jgi:hypothetical protein
MDRFRGALPGLAVGTLIAVATLAYPVWYMLKGPEHVTIVTPAQAYSADLLAWLVPMSNQLLSTPGSAHLAQKLSGFPATVIDGSYVGLPMAVMLVAIVWRYRRVALIPIVALMTVISFIGTLGPTLIVDHHDTGLWLPGRVLLHLPLLQTIWPYRIELFVALGVAVLFAVGLDRFHDEYSAKLPKHRRTTFIVQALVLLLALAPLVPVPYAATSIPTPTYLQTAAHDEIPPGSVVVMYPFPGESDSVSMLWQAQDAMRYRLAGGNAWAPGPGGVTEISDALSVTQSALDGIYLRGSAPVITPKLQKGILSDLKQWRASTIVVDLAAPGSRLVVEMFRRALGATPRYQQGVAVWYRLRSGAG